MIPPNILQQMNAVTGKNVSLTPQGQPTRAQQIRDLAAKAKPAVATTPTPAAPATPNLGQLDAAQVKQGADKITSSITEGASKFAAEPTTPMGTIKRTGDLLEAGLGTAAGGAQAVFAPITAVIQKALSHSGGTPSITAPNPADSHIAAWAQKHPEAAKNLMDAITVATAAMGDVGGVANPLNTDLGQAGKDFVDTMKDAATSINTPAPETAPVKPAGPDNKFVRDLVTPQQTTGKTGTLTQNMKAGRVEEGGILSGRTINPDARQIAIENEVKSVPGISSKNTSLENLNAIHKEIGTTASNLENQLASREVQPIVTQEHWDNYLNGVKQDIAENPLITGDAESTASKIINKFQSLLPKEGDITASDILKARKGLDSWIKSVKGNLAFDPKTENAVSIAVRATRQGANDLLEATAPDVAVKAMLRRQSLLYDAIDNIAPKAAKEAGSVVGRIAKGIKEHPVLSTGAGVVGLDVLLHKFGL